MILGGNYEGRDAFPGSVARLCLQFCSFFFQVSRVSICFLCCRGLNASGLQLHCDFIYMSASGPKSRSHTHTFLLQTFIRDLAERLRSELNVAAAFIWILQVTERMVRPLQKQTPEKAIKRIHLFCLFIFSNAI